MSWDRSTNQCSFLHCGPVRSHHHTHSGTSLEGSDTFQTRRCSGSYTHRCLWGGEKDSLCFCLFDTTCLEETVTRSTLAGLAVFCRSEAHLTLAAIASRGVQTLAVLTQVHIVCTLVHVWEGHIKNLQCAGHTVAGFNRDSSDSLTGAWKAISVEALFAGAPVGSWRVDAVCVGIAVVVLCSTFIFICRREKWKA